MDKTGYNEILTWDKNMDIWRDIHLGYNRITWDKYEDNKTDINLDIKYGDLWGYKGIIVDILKG